MRLWCGVLIRSYDIYKKLGIGLAGWVQRTQGFSVNVGEAFAPVLARLGLELDCVEVGRNYKINRADTVEYVGRTQPEALKSTPGAFSTWAGRPLGRL